MQSVWERKGQVVSRAYLQKYGLRLSQVPTLLVLGDGNLRLFFGGRDLCNRSRLMAVDIDPKNAMKIICEYAGPLFPLAIQGEFDCDGMAPSSFINTDEELLLFYTAIKLNGMPQYDTSIGLAYADKSQLNFNRKCPGPILSKGPFDPYGVITPCVLKEQDTFFLWYSSTVYWRPEQKPHPDHAYNIRFARSKDLYQWQCAPTPAIDFKSELESGLIRPWVQKNQDGLYEMWYSYRGPYDLERTSLRKYKIGYSVSHNGMDWVRMDEGHVWSSPAVEGDWDYDMQCYQTVITLNKKQYMFYCGNAYGAEGIGYAERRLV